MPGTSELKGNSAKLGTGLGVRLKLVDGKHEWHLDQFAINDS